LKLQAGSTLGQETEGAVVGLQNSSRAWPVLCSGSPKLAEFGAEEAAAAASPQGCKLSLDSFARVSEML